MKTKLAIVIGCLAIALSTSSFSWWSKWDACHEESGSECDYCNTAQCTDLGYGNNDQMSLAQYCEAFGNIGAR